MDFKGQVSDLVAPQLYAEPLLVSSPEQCLFYHTTDLPTFGTVKGFWDLRGKENRYLGGVNLKGKRVLEIGPASGGLTFHMEREGADVVSIEAPVNHRMEYCWDIPQCLPPGLEARIAESQSAMGVLHNAYWLCHRLFNSKANVHYGSAYDIPPALGLFDVATLGCVLLHNKNPFLILEGVARLTMETMVIVEIEPADRSNDAGPIFLRNDNEFYNGWFHFPPKFTARVLRTMGFPRSKITYHEQLMGDQSVRLYTVVASRT
jgi:hypothetical protein